MLSRKILVTFLLLALFGAFTAGVAHLFALRFAVGDIYPPYSTLRTDPLGGKALYDSLGALPGVSVSRHFRAIKHLDSGAGLTLFYTGVPPRSAWESSEIDDFEKLLRQGMRLVLTYSAVTEKSDQKSSRSKPKKKKKEDEETPVKILDAGEFATRWGFHVRELKLKENAAADLQARLRNGATEPLIAWHSLTYFDTLPKSWSVLYECEHQPVIIEKKFGNGSLVLCSDSYFLSNEALRRDRAPALLTMLAGGHTRIVFDELHHGVADRPGIAQLARKYGLGSFAAALLVLAGLFIWQNAVPLVPPRAETGGPGDVLVGKDSFGGFVNLLRRNIAPDALLNTCWNAWRQSFSHQTRVTKEQLARAEAIVSDAPANQVVAGFRELRTLLNKTKSK